MGHQLGTCGSCGREWHSKLNGSPVLPVRVPISEDGGSVMAVCEICAPDLPVAKIAEFAMLAYVASGKTMPIEPIDMALGFPSIPQLAEPTAVLGAWVRRQHALGAR